MQKAKISKRVGRQLYRSSPTILTVVASVGVIVTTITAVRATPKAVKLLKEAELEKGENLTKVEIIRVAGPSYIPSALLGISTIVCIFGANALNQKKQASLMSAYVMLNESYKQYRKSAKIVYGEDADDKIHVEMAKDAMVATYDWGYQVYNMDMDSESERLLFYDLSSKKYFRTTMAAVLNAQYHVNRNLAIRGDCSLNEYLSFLGVEGIDGGDDLGWDISYMVEEMDCYWLDFDNYKSTLEDGLECIMIDTMTVNKFE
jgi:hypothetical protein|uniref:Uncharacterized protein n=1 Tax=Siphoviridae sp. ctcj91 TaxID=2826395 RepID=A0A8S5QXQ1_9CAUD|nr:MAG TPA: hypothetical protein [Siphoviridae sp. ctcj91]